MTEQRPRILIEPERVGTDGDGASLLMQTYGVTLDPWQRLVVDSFLGTDSTGNYVTTACGISAPRQNGKNIILETIELYALLVNGAKILHTAHQMRTAKKSFRRLASIFENKKHPEITREVAKIRYGIGEEAIELKNGGSIEFLARTRQGARGFDAISLVVIDEAQEATNDQLEALLSTLSASATGTRQIIYAGTPPYAGIAGEVFRKYRQSCIMSENENTRNSWFEWSIEGDKVEDLDISNKEVWRACNPALSMGRLSYEFTQSEYDSLTAEGFARERLGWWHTPQEDRHTPAIDQIKWNACKSTDPKPNGKCAYGVKFSADGSEVCLSGAVIDAKTKRARITLIKRQLTGEGLSELASWLNARYHIASCIVLDGRNGADVLNDKLREVWVFKDSIIRPSASQVCQSASLLVNEIAERRLTWYAEQDELNASAISATKRPIGQGWGFGGEDCTAIESCSLALWGVTSSKRNPQAKMRIG